MPNNLDIHLSANILIRKHGDTAKDYAKKQLEEHKKESDSEGAAVWLAIMQAIVAMTTSEGTRH